MPEVADQYREGFDPILRPEDEPDWENPGKRYSDVVHREMARVEANDALAMIFPIWWWSFPAMLKGWIDRVFNNEWAYGTGKLSLQYGLPIGLSAGDDAMYAKRGYDRAIETQIVTGVMNYSGIESARFEYLHHANEGGDEARAMIERGRMFGREFPKKLSSSGS